MLVVILYINKDSRKTEILRKALLSNPTATPALVVLQPEQSQAPKLAALESFYCTRSEYGTFGYGV